MYAKPVSRAHPGLVVLTLDESLSMAEPLPGTSDPKYRWVERLSGNLFHELLARSTEADGDSIAIKPRYFVYLLAYGDSQRPWLPSIVDIGEAARRYTSAGNSLGLAGNMSGTDSRSALEAITRVVESAVTDPRFAHSYPPIVFHLTDGESQTDATSAAARLRALVTSDGNVLLANALIGATTNLRYQGPSDFPGYVTVDEAGPSAYSRRLFEMSSIIPESMRSNLIEFGVFPAIRPGARLFFDVRTKESLKHALQVVGSVGAGNIAPSPAAVAQ